MTDNVRAVPIGGMIVSEGPNDVLVAYGLGSCVAVCLYDPVARVGGMLHALLPTNTNENRGRGNPAKNRGKGNPTKFVDQGTPLLIESLLERGARRSRLIARLCGGAQVVSAPGFNNPMDIGERNVLAAEAALQAAGIRVQAQATGGHIGRTVRLYIATGQVTVRSLEQGEQALT